jgi:hypothetical protein
MRPTIAHWSTGAMWICTHGPWAGCTKQFLRGDHIELDPRIWAGSREIGGGIPIVGLKLDELDPRSLLVVFVVDETFDIGNRLDELGAQILCLLRAEAPFDVVNADENHAVSFPGCRRRIPPGPR